MYFQITSLQCGYDNSMFVVVVWIPLTCSMLFDDLLSISQYSNTLAPSSEDLILAKVVAVRLR